MAATIHELAQIQMREENAVIERERERIKEPEPKIDYYEETMKYYNTKLEKQQKGKRLVKSNDVPWIQARQGLLKFYSNPAFWDELAAPGWNLFMQRVIKQSGRHIHQGGLPIYIVEGKGYSVVDGVKYEWKKGDLLVLPFKPKGVEHQHFNEDPDNPPTWVALRFCPWADWVAGGLKQVLPHPDWPGDKKTS